MAEKKTTRGSKAKSTPIQRTLFDLFPTKRQDEATNNTQDINENQATEVASVRGIMPPVAPTVPGALDQPMSQETSTELLQEKTQPVPNSLPRKFYSIFERSDASRKTTALPATHDSGRDGITIMDHQVVAGPLHSDRSSDARIHGSSPHDPIFVCDPPSKSPTDRSFSQPSSSILSTTARNHDTNHSDKAVLHIKTAKSVEAPFPSQDLQHVRGPQNSFSSPVLNFGRRINKKQTILFTDTSKSLAGLAMLDKGLHDRSAACAQLLTVFNALDRQNYFKTIPSEHIRLHPAVRQLLDAPLPPASAFSQMTWPDRWRPTRAEQVLGNERQALYLRDWLRSLELEFINDVPVVPPPQQDMKTKGKRKVKVERDLKRPRVVRAVEKKKRKKQRVDSEEEDDWIVGTDESSEQDSTDGDSEDEYGEGDQNRLTNVTLDQPTPGEHHADTPHVPHIFHTKLTNTILIAGPPGCGKTAAVYACADELGWEVFEVYPGIGKRNASSLDNLVGDVGKNHLVRKSHHHSQTRALPGQKGRVQAKNNMTLRAIGTEDRPIEIEDGEDQGENSSHRSTLIGDFGFVGSSPTKLGLDGRPITQSMVLLEEVDILFKEDSNFWPAVVSLIKDCKRPVIMTCNDVTLVPIDDLPLQDILMFQSIPPPLAVSYLQSLCLAEGQFIERQELRQLYETTYELSAVDQSVVNPCRDGLPVPDLRRTIHQLQFLCSGNTKYCTSTEANTYNVDWNSWGYHTDLLSYADSVVEKPKVVSLSTADEDELGHTQLSEIFSIDDDEIVHVMFQAAIRRIGSIITNTNTQPHVAYQQRIREAFRNSAWTTRMSVMCLDYIPWMRMMVSIEDKNASEGVERPGRMRTRTTRYVRVISLSEEQRRALDYYYS